MAQKKKGIFELFAILIQDFFRILQILKHCDSREVMTFEYSYYSNTSIFCVMHPL